MGDVGNYCCSCLENTEAINTQLWVHRRFPTRLLKGIVVQFQIGNAEEATIEIPEQKFLSIYQVALFFQVVFLAKIVFHKDLWFFQWMTIGQCSAVISYCWKSNLKSSRSEIDGSIGRSQSFKILYDGFLYFQSAESLIHVVWWLAWKRSRAVFRTNVSSASLS